MERRCPEANFCSSLPRQGPRTKTVFRPASPFAETREGETIVQRTLEILKKSPERELAVPILGSALGETDLSRPALEILRAAPETRAPREIIRHYDQLNETDQRSLQEGMRGRLLVACHQLLRSDQTRTRGNIAAFATHVLEASPDSWPDVLPILLVLIDDPRHGVRETARRSFVTGLKRLDGAELAKAGSARNPVINGLTVLIRRFDQHHDIDLIESLFHMGNPGHDLLARAVGEKWDAAEAIQNVAKSNSAHLGVVIGALFRWLRSPFKTTRECARSILRGRTDAEFLEGVADRLEARIGTGEGDPNRRSEEDYPVYRHIRWDLLPAKKITSLSDNTLLRIIGYLQGSGGTAEERGSRLASLLPHAQGSIQLEILHLLREYPTVGLVDPLAPLLESPDPAIQQSATELLEADGTPQVFQLLIRQLSSSNDDVRAAAQRKLSGQSLPILFDAFHELAPSTRSELLPLLDRVDLHFTGQLRRALRSGEERDTVLALRTVIEGHKVSELEDNLLDLTVSPSPKIRATLARALAHVSREVGLHYLRLFLTDSNPRVVANAVECLADLGDSRSASMIGELREHDDPRVRVNSLVALDRLGDRSARLMLRSLANREGTDPLTKSATWGLAQLENER